MVDKSMIIRDLLDAEASILIARPRRFGKTINMSMMHEFFRCDKQDQGELFKIAKGRETLKTALATAFQQIEEKDYAAKIRDAGCQKLTQIGIATKGKQIAIEVRIKSV